MTGLGLIAKTVKNYLSNAFQKLRVKRRAQAAALYARQIGKDRRLAEEYRDRCAGIGLDDAGDRRKGE